VAAIRPSWFLGHGRSCGYWAAADHVSSWGMVGPVGQGLPCGRVGSWGMAGVVGLGLPGGHFASRGMVGAVCLGLPGSRGFPGTWEEL